jgi:hypothetical protein
MLITSFGWRATDMTGYAIQIAKKIWREREHSPITCPVLSISAVMKDPSEEFLK